MSLPSAQFNISNYEIRNRRDRDTNGSEWVNRIYEKGLITKRLKDCEIQICEKFALSLQYPRENASDIDHPLIIILSFFLKN